MNATARAVSGVLLVGVAVWLAHRIWHAGGELA